MAFRLRNHHSRPGKWIEHDVALIGTEKDHPLDQVRRKWTGMLDGRRSPSALDGDLELPDVVRPFAAGVVSLGPLPPPLLELLRIANVVDAVLELRPFYEVKNVLEGVAETDRKS